jgi:hypothetical protein
MIFFDKESDIPTEKAEERGYKRYKFALKEVLILLRVCGREIRMRPERIRPIASHCNAVRLSWFKGWEKAIIKRG